MASSHLLFLGTYTRDGTSEGIYAIRLDQDTGALSVPVSVAGGPDPAWITLSPDQRFLYTIQPTAAQARGFAVDAATTRLNPLGLENPPLSAQPMSAPSHLAVDATGRVLLAANYHEGFVATIPIHSDGGLGAPNRFTHQGRGPHPTRQTKSHVHSVTLAPDNRYVIVADLGLDKIFSYALDSAKGQLTPANPAFVVTEAGAGPRHFKFSSNGRQGYAINELNNTLTVYYYAAEHGTLTPRQSVSTLPPECQSPSSAAEARVHPNGAFLYASNRGHDSIAVFAVDPAEGRLAPVEFVASGGKNPRNFALSPDGQWLVCAHQDTPLLTVFRVDGRTGRLTRTSHTANVPPVCASSSIVSAVTSLLRRG